MPQLSIYQPPIGGLITGVIVGRNRQSSGGSYMAKEELDWNPDWNKEIEDEEWDCPDDLFPDPIFNEVGE